MRAPFADSRCYFDDLTRELPDDETVRMTYGVLERLVEDRGRDY